MAHGDDRGVVVRRRKNGNREVLIETSMIESGAYIYPNRSIRRPNPRIVNQVGANTATTVSKKSGAVHLPITCQHIFISTGGKG